MLRIFFSAVSAVSAVGVFFTGSLALRTLIAEFFQIFLVGAGQDIEERVEAAIERAAQLGDSAVDDVERQAGGRSVGELDRPFADAFQGAFRNQTNAVDERVSRHTADSKLELTQ